MTEAQKRTELALQALREAVDELMERKRRLGQQVVVWENGRVVRKIPPPRDGSGAKDGAPASGNGR